MIRDIVGSFKDNVSQKTSNPFLATILIVWTFKNWRLLYGLLYFDKEHNLNDRISYINCYYLNVNFYENLGITIIYSFGVLVGTYVLLGIARVIVDYYNKVIVPFISKLTDKSSIVLKSDYINLFKQNEELERKYSDERESRIKAKNDLEIFETKYAELVLEKVSNDRLKIENKDLVKKITSLEANIAKYAQLKDESSKLLADHKNMTRKLDEIGPLVSKYEKIIEEQEEVIRVMKEKENFVKSSKESKYAKKLQELSLKEKFVDTGMSILNFEPLPQKDKDLRYFVSFGLIIHGSGSDEPGTQYFDFTDFGRKLYGYILES